MDPQTVVKHKPTGRMGVVVMDRWGCCDDSETPVVFEGTNYFTGIPTKELDIIRIENAIADAEKCGAGRGEETCIFLVFGGGKFECQRFGSMRDSLLSQNMRAKRHPIELYPGCQLDT